MFIISINSIIYNLDYLNHMDFIIDSLDETDTFETVGYWILEHDDRYLDVKVYDPGLPPCPGGLSPCPADKNSFIIPKVFCGFTQCIGLTNKNNKDGYNPEGEPIIMNIFINIHEKV